MEEKKFDFIPLGRRVVIYRDVPDVGGLKLTEELERESSPDTGIIAKVGQIGFWNKWVRGIRPGKKIAFVKYSPIKIGKTYGEWIFLDVDNILGIET